jgi:parvulin-like peptidyl-prolyl isomerase
MLKQLRENTKTILWVVVVAFVVSIFAVWGMNFRSGGSGGQPGEVSNIIGSVDGMELTRQMYQNNTQELYTNLRAQRGEDYRLSDTEGYRLREQAWEMGIQKAIIAREIDRLDITVTDNELVSFLRRNPHPSLRQMFTDEEGNFDYQAYLQALSNPDADWTELERWGRSVIPELKLETMLSSQVHVSDMEIRERFNRQNTRIKALYVKIPFVVEEPPYEPTDQEISALFEKRKDDFLTPEKRAIRMIRIEKAATELDELDIFERMTELREELMGDYTFAEAAKQESDDYNTAQNGGDLGFFDRGVMDSLFTETAFALEVGEISEPVRTQYGYHLIKMDEKKVEEGVEKVKASHILMRVEPGYDTIDSLRTLITDLRETIIEKGLSTAAADFGLEVSEPEPFAQGAFIKDHGYLPQIVNFTFNNKVGKISNTLETEQYIYIVEVIRIIRETTMPLEEARPVLVEQIRTERKETAALETAKELREMAVTGGDLEAAAHSFEIEVGETTPFTIDQTIPGIGMGTGFATAAYELQTGRISPPVKGYGEWFVLQVIDRAPGEPSELATQRQTILQLLRQENASRFLALWYDQLRKSAKVVDNRESTLN